jgi:hypothetical protein
MAVTIHSASSKYMDMCIQRAHRFIALVEEETQKCLREGGRVDFASSIASTHKQLEDIQKTYKDNFILFKLLEETNLADQWSQDQKEKSCLMVKLAGFVHKVYTCVAKTGKFPVYLRTPSSWNIDPKLKKAYELWISIANANDAREKLAARSAINGEPDAGNDADAGVPVVLESGSKT